jgi:long-subunit acyl-CoA synthetase (AMP-forming)/GNAT superfamily N-acetyltransferase
MDRTAASAAPPPAALIEQLRGSAARSVQANLTSLGEALAHAAREGPGATEELDRATVAGLLAAPQPDAILERLELDLLAALAERCTARLERAGSPAPLALRHLGWDVLDRLPRPAVVRRIAPEEVEAWARRFLRLIEASQLTVGPLFRHRAASYGSKVLFELPGPGDGFVRSLSWREVSGRVERLARGLLALDPEENVGPVAIVSENCIEMALVDLACLSSGLVNVLIPAGATEPDVGAMLRRSGARSVVVSGRDELRKVLGNRDALPELRWILSIEPQIPAGAEGPITLEQVAAGADRVPATRVRERSEAVTVDDLASVMYTSGTTGQPKGIRFSHRNIVFKRFARGLALPEIGDGDVFLCYLPLYHTFGRFLELLGCVHWGSVYCFLDNPSAEALLRGMRRHRPTAFISVPKKWIELYEAIAARADPLRSTDDELRLATREVTGGRLRWGLSAAGQLDSEIFRFFQRNGIDLMSGFGMTEATGGITMTPPGRYKDDSLGPALPGIETRLAEDGELLVRGPYVMLGYVDPPEGEAGLDEAGWLHTGDLMERDGEGFLRLIDRKKEIYKNIKGETIAPQRVEHLFRDFEAVRRAFLVGDHRPYNTVLLYPNPDYRELDLRALPPQELRDHFRSIVVSVNKFLAPFERIVDFALVDRDLEADRGELTPKGTPRRSVVERNFADTIRLMYRRTSVRVGGVELIVPNWLFRELGLTAQDIRVAGEALVIPSVGARLTVRARGRGAVQIGSCLYARRRGPLHLGLLLTSPRLWLGNEELASFVPLDLPALERPGRTEGLEWRGRAAPFAPDAERRQALERAAAKAEHDLFDLHLAALMLASPDPQEASTAVGLLEQVLGRRREGSLAESARLVLARTAVASAGEVRRRGFRAVVGTEPEFRFAETLRSFLAGPQPLLDRQTRAALVEQDLSDARLEAFLSAAREAIQDSATSHRAAARAISLLRFLSEYGVAHPARYRRVRALLVQAKLIAPNERVRRFAAQAADELTRGFRQWLGPPTRIAVDAETGDEYRWDDVVMFDDEVDPDDRRRILDALRRTSFLREGVFLFYGGATIQLGDIPPGGIWVRPLGSRHGKSVYRMTIQTPHRGTFDLAVNVNRSLPREAIEEEIHWLVLCGDAKDKQPLVEDFGGYWAEQDLWSEEFIPGETLERVMRRLSRDEDAERLPQLWPFLAWTTLAAYVDFWNRTGRRWEIADGGMANVVVSSHDYHAGARIVSLSSRRPHGGLIPMLLGMHADLVRPAEERYPALRGLVPWRIVLSSIPEVLGEAEGLALLRTALGEPEGAVPEKLRHELAGFVAGVERDGFRPMRLHFAANRYRRWARLNAGSTPQARARTLQDIYETYGLPKLVHAQPEMRIRFFLDTVFEGSPAPLVDGLDALIGRIRRGERAGERLIEAVADLRSRLELGPDDDYFLARLTLPHLRPEDAAGFVMADRAGKHPGEIVVRLEDNEGNAFRVRHAMNPREIARLHQQFVAAKLDVRFRPEHRYLVALNDRSQIIGGIYYEVGEDGQSAHLEKIVVAESHRQKGVADALILEFFNRLRAAGVRAVTTGFFRQAFFYSHGFTIEKGHAGLVKSLGEG